MPGDVGITSKKSKMHEEPKLEFSHGNKVRIATQSVFSIARQDIAL